MKLLNKTISEISKFLLLFNLCLYPVKGFTETSDRFLLKIVDKTISLKDINFQLRNFQALQCAYPSSIIQNYFGENFLKTWKSFLAKMPMNDKDISLYMHSQEEFLKSLRLYFKLLRYSLDQRGEVSKEVTSLMKESLRESKCSKDVFFKKRLKTSFVELLKAELYLKSRYGNQLKDERNASTVKDSIDLFMESLDKQFYHEYYR